MKMQERTEQGGPPSGDRKCGTGGNPALVEERDHLSSIDGRKKLGNERRVPLLVGAGEPRGRMPQYELRAAGVPPL